VTRNRSGFTLIELLVVITIIGILIALLFPIYSTVMRTVQETYCETNLSELAKVISAYCQANEGYFPFIGSRTDDGTGWTVKPSAGDWLYVPFRQGSIDIKSNPQDPMNGDMERGALLKNKLVGKLDTFYCPVDMDLGLVRGPGTEQNPSIRLTNCLRYTIANTTPPVIRPATSYVINSSITYGDTEFSGVRRARRMSDFGAWTFLLIEESSGDTDHDEMASACNRAFMSPVVTSQDPLPRTLTSRHRWGGYVACMDGHVEWMSAGNPKDPNYNDKDQTTFEYYRTQVSDQMRSQNRAWYYTAKTRWNP
jgi:prepilin-type N-terminal cleavage/methylation domain-containing protein